MKIETCFLPGFETPDIYSFDALKPGVETDVIISMTMTCPMLKAVGGRLYVPALAVKTYFGPTPMIRFRCGKDDVLPHEFLVPGLERKQFRTYDVILYADTPEVRRNLKIQNPKLVLAERYSLVLRRMKRSRNKLKREREGAQNGNSAGGPAPQDHQS